jgi:predicted nucleic acid-binding protein
VFVAEAADLRLVTADRRLARAFPGRVQEIEDVLSGK